LLHLRQNIDIGQKAFNIKRLNGTMGRDGEMLPSVQTKNSMAAAVMGPFNALKIREGLKVFDTPVPLGVASRLFNYLFAFWHERLHVKNKCIVPYTILNKQADGEASTSETPGKRRSR
jgi:hypothetical protein